MTRRCLALVLLAFTAPLMAQTQWDFEHSYRTVFDANADDHLVHTANTQKVRESWGPTFWTPIATGQEALVRYHFSFPRTTNRVALHARTATWNYPLGVGEASLWGSTDGQSWTLLLDNPVPNHIDRGLNFDGDLPASLTGTTNLWIECRMTRHSGSYSYGGAQFSRIGPGNPSNERAFSLRAEFASSSASYTTYRQSCPSSVGLPTLSATNPVIGQPWRLTVDNLRANTSGYLFFALDDQRLGVAQLPLELTSIGAPGCYINVNTLPRSGAIMHPLPSNASGSARVQVGIPNNAAIIGSVFFNQYVSLDAPASRPLRLTTTNAGRGIIGL